MSDVDEPRVGIVIRTKNRPWFLRRALADIVAQRFEGWTAVIVNDGGDPAPVEQAVTEHSGTANRLRVVHHEAPRGRSAAANAGLAVLTTEFVVLHDDDDLWDPDFLRAAVDRLDAHPGDAGVMVRTEIVYEAERDGAFVEVGRAPFWPEMTSVSYGEFLQVNRAVPIGHLYRRRLHDELGGYREDLHAVEDWEFTLRVLQRYDIGFLGARPLAFWMQRRGVAGELGNSMFALAADHDIYDRRVRDEALRAWVRGQGDGLPLYLARVVRDEVARQLDERLSLGQRAARSLRRLRDRWRR
ncbi:glycosyltransferase [Microbacterium sp. 67-17]|uniref:glycosyltransferase n=1 Tax=Microbacterium sp. 67-17 TaxID=1895782 RepID=UPI000AA71374|nr:glycosyltransferase [Microbacterium sp. 67-17]